ncbi:MAG TPA: UDP-N-acetylmuramoyl-L-alanyl-D-glutamate--2,6-diaminopimelate ligase [Candidatus Limnocylindrales bacterium]|nr:UDP-N-acetylmuramoyl-L-alanyl-D-glutamate--2,6-diaminopimelate ligase [Candidatus Limnocylindrales bacterium]
MTVAPSGQTSTPGRSRRLGELIALLEARGLLRSVIPGGPTAPGSVTVSGIAYDSRRIQGGELFAALPGERVDGHDYAADSVGAGAGAVLGERALPGLGVPQLLVERSRAALALAAAWFYDFPSHRLGIVGITGTDGKTTTCFLVRAILEAAGQPSGLVGTVDVLVGGQARGNPARATTPEAPELQGLLAEMVEAGDRFAVVESTSHGLAQERVGAIAYDVAVLTNIGHEHLEFHRTHEAYLTAKRTLFERLAAGPDNPDKGWGKHGIVNADEESADAFASAAREAGARLWSYGSPASADVRAVRLEETARGLRVRVRTPRWEETIALRLAGRFNAHNALAAISAGEALDLDPAAIRAGLEALPGVPGRMERVEAGQPFVVVVDYAHTPEALATVLDNLAPLAAAGGGGLIAVFGSAGERDVLKRPMMGRVAGERCRLVVLTDEDPRGEDRVGILEQIAEGAERSGRRRGHDLLLVPDREAAIEAALEQARPGDVVILAGKGHERTIEIGGGSMPWNEADAARRALAVLGFRGHS